MSPASRRRITVLAAAVAALALLGGCGSGTGYGDPGEAGPTTDGAPTTVDTPVGERPAFTADDYSYTLVVSCFCPGAGTQTRITVADGEVTQAHQVPRSPAVPAFLRLTIPEIIDRALDPRVDRVTLDWPADQAWPDSAGLDPIQDAVDDEIGYAISEVEVTG
ncbi:DUF6174 domain-containing protein [Nocardioides taihuensis]|uniref:DUF6174 domain-containing protein n=1 Tax=Nocardioides taihuensis TaxID=1835606 RepID=A0ABW0BHR0_9ACTN